MTEPFVAPTEMTPAPIVFVPPVEKPLPVQAVAFAEDQVSVAPLPEVIEVGDAVRVTDGVVGYGLVTVFPVTVITTVPSTA